MVIGRSLRRFSYVRMPTPLSFRGIARGVRIQLSEQYSAEHGQDLDNDIGVWHLMGLILCLSAARWRLDSDAARHAKCCPLAIACAYKLLTSAQLRKSPLVLRRV